MHTHTHAARDREREKEGEERSVYFESGNKKEEKHA